MQNYYHNKYGDTRAILYKKGNSFGVGVSSFGKKEGKKREKADET